MKLQEIQTCRCTSQVHIPFSICWSEDNYIAMASDKGIDTVEFQPSVNNKKPSMGVQRHFMEPSKYLPTSKCGVDMDKLFNFLGSAEMTNLVIDDTMAPDFKGMNFNVVTRQLGWAKFDEKVLSRSLLTVLTNGGALSLYSLQGSEWMEVLDIAQLWQAKSSLLWKPPPNDASTTDLLDVLKMRSYRIKITAFAWTGSKSTTNLLFTGTMDGTLCAWEVSYARGSCKLEAELLRGVEASYMKITSLTIIQTEEYKCLLFYATKSGQIQAIPVIITDVVEFQEPLDIWDERDEIVVPPGGLEAEMILGYVILAVAKGPHLLVFLITAESQLLSYTAMNSGDISITGLHFMTSTQLFVTTWSGKIQVISIGVESDTSIKLHSNSVGGPSKTENMGIMGVAFSKSKAIICLGYSLKVNFNHLFLRELSSLVFCALPEITNPLELIRSYSGSLNNIWDALEVIRVGFLSKTDKDWAQFNSVVDSDQFDNMEIAQLKKNLWLFNHLLNFDSSGMEDAENYRELGKEIHNLVTAHHIFKRSSTLLADTSRSAEANMSLSLMKKWLIYFESNLDSDNYPSTQGILTVILEQLNACPEADEKEICFLCGSGPEDEATGEMKNWRCSTGHELPRCSISFLQCNALPPYVCNSCNIVAHPTVVNSEGFCHCIYCDGYLQLPANMIHSKH